MSNPPLRSSGLSLPASGKSLRMPENTPPAGKTVHCAPSNPDDPAGACIDQVPALPPALQQILSHEAIALPAPQFSIVTAASHGAQSLQGAVKQMLQLEISKEALLHYAASRHVAVEVRSDKGESASLHKTDEHHARQKRSWHDMHMNPLILPQQVASTPGTETDEGTITDKKTKNRPSHLFVPHDHACLASNERPAGQDGQYGPDLLLQHMAIVCMPSPDFHCLCPRQASTCLLKSFQPVSHAGKTSGEVDDGKQELIAPVGRSAGSGREGHSRKR